MPAAAVWALEVVPHDQEADPRSRALRQILQDLGAPTAGVTHGRLYLIAASPTPQLTAAVCGLCHDPVLTEVASGDAGAGWVIEVLPHPGVTDAEGDTLAEALRRDGFPEVQARAVAHAFRAAGLEDVAGHQDVTGRDRATAGRTPPSRHWRSP